MRAEAMLGMQECLQTRGVMKSGVGETIGEGIEWWHASIEGM